MKNIILAVALIFITFTTQGNESLDIVAIGKANISNDKIYFKYDLDSALTKRRREMQEIQKVIASDFDFYSERFEQATSAMNTRYLVDIKLASSGSNNANVDLKIQDGLNKSNLIPSKNLVVPLNRLRKAAHTIADAIYQSITGKESVFLSKVIFVSNRGSTKRKPIKELYEMDFDGGNKKRLTRHRGTVIGPAISKDKSRILYSLIKDGVRKRNVNLYVYEYATGKSRLISSRKGLNAGAIFMPDENEIMLTLSHTGNAELYVMNLKTNKLRRVTKHFSPDVDPSISSDGKLLTFLSARSGSAMIYTANPMGIESSVKRISFVGKYNATPRFSPEGSEIVFSSWMDNRFDLFRLDSNGANLVRLTKNFGSNEDPTYSNDGQFIAFSSQRVLSKTRAVQNIYIMTREGKILRSLTDNFGNCITPRWSK